MADVNPLLQGIDSNPSGATNRQAGQDNPLLSGIEPKGVVAPSAKNPLTTGITERTYPSVGGTYNSTTGGSETPLVKTPRGYADEPAQGGMVRDHIIPIELGGSSVKSNLQYQTTADAKYKDSVENYITDQYKQGKMTLAEARGKALDWQNVEVPASGKFYIKQPAYNQKDFTGMGAVKTFLSMLPDSAKTVGSYLSTKVRQIIYPGLPEDIASDDTKFKDYLEYQKQNPLYGSALKLGKETAEHPIKSLADFGTGIAHGIMDTIGTAVLNLATDAKDRPYAVQGLQDTLLKYLPSQETNWYEGSRVGGQAAPMIAVGGVAGELGGLAGEALAGPGGKAVGATIGNTAGFVGGGQTMVPREASIDQRAHQAMNDLVNLGLFTLGSKAYEQAKASITNGISNNEALADDLKSNVPDEFKDQQYLDTQNKLQDNVRFYQAHGGMGAGDEAPSAALRDIGELIKTPEGEHIANDGVMRAIASGDIQVGEDGKATLYRVGDVSDKNGLFSAASTKEAARTFADQNGGSDITEIKVDPHDIKYNIGGPEKEVLLSKDALNPGPKLTDANVDEFVKDPSSVKLFRGENEGTKGGVTFTTDEKYAGKFGENEVSGVLPPDAKVYKVTAEDLDQALKGGITDEKGFFKSMFEKGYDALVTKDSRTDDTNVVVNPDSMDGMKASKFDSQAGFVDVGKAVSDIQETAQAMRDNFEKAKQTRVTAEGVDAGLRQLQGQMEVDKMELGKIYKEADLTPEEERNIYTWREDHEAVQLTEREIQAEKDIIEPIKKEQADILNELKDKGIPTDNLDDHNSRQVIDKSKFWSDLEGGEKPSTISQGLLTKTTGTMKGRTMFALEDDEGNRQVVSIKSGDVTGWTDGEASDMGSMAKGDDYEKIMDEETGKIDEKITKLETERKTLARNVGTSKAAQRRIVNIVNQVQDLLAERSDIVEKYNPSTLADKAFTDDNGKTWTVKQATTEEIEANTNLRYSKFSLANELINLQKLRATQRASDWLESFKESPEFGQIAVKVGQGDAPVNFRLSNSPYFRGYLMDPEVANAVDRFTRYNFGDDGLLNLTKVNLYVRNVSLFNPIFHPFVNVLPNWLHAQGLFGLLNPADWGNKFGSGIDAIRAVANPLEAPSEDMPSYAELLDKGATLTSSRMQETLSDAIKAKLAGELEADPTPMGQLSKSLGWANPVKWADFLVGGRGISARISFGSEDVARLQIIYDEIRNGATPEEAIETVDKVFPTNRISEGQWDAANKMLGTKLSNAIANPNVTMFSGYHASLIETLANDAKDMLGRLYPGGEPTDFGTKAGAADRIAMLVVGLTVLYPAYDAILKKVTGNKTAESTRGGVFAVPDNVYRALRGKEGFAQAIAKEATPAPVTQALLETWFNKDFFTGNDVVPKGDPSFINNLKNFATGMGSEVLNKINPLQNAQNVISGQKPLSSFLWSELGVKTPKATPSTANVQSLIYDQRPGLLSQVKALWAQGKYQEAQDIMTHYNSNLMQNAIDALQENGHPIQDENALRAWLRDTGLKAYWLKPPSDEVMQNYQANAKKTPLQKVLK